jgi:K+ potassium transporter
MEGLESVSPKLVQFVIPGTVGILAVLFAIQRFGTGRLGFVFGWVMLVWFVVLGAMGFVWIRRNPSVLRAFNPIYALQVLKTNGWSALRLMGAVILAVTSAEALYADMGHFGREANFAGLACRGPARARAQLSRTGCAGPAQSRDASIGRGSLFFHGSAGVADTGPGGAGHHGDGDRLAGADFRGVFSYGPGAAIGFFSEVPRDTYEPARTRAGLGSRMPNRRVIDRKLRFEFARDLEQPIFHAFELRHPTLACLLLSRINQSGFHLIALRMKGIYARCLSPINVKNLASLLGGGPVAYAGFGRKRRTCQASS